MSHYDLSNQDEAVIVPSGGAKVLAAASSVLELGEGNTLTNAHLSSDQTTAEVLLCGFGTKNLKKM